jgi:hypothetical protein
MLGQNEINEDLQKMNDAQLEEHESDKVDEEKEEGTNAAEVDDETLEETEHNKTGNKKRKATIQPTKRLPTTRGRKVGV